MTPLLLYRPSFDARSGAGRLLLAQWRGLNARGRAAQLGCERGALRFRLRTGAPVRKLRLDAVRARAAAGAPVVDHGMCVPEAAIVFVHNVMTEANVYLRRPALAAQVAAEAELFRELGSRGTPVVANSQLVRAALVEHFGLNESNVAVAYPGVDTTAFSAARAPALRARARARLGLAKDVPLVGFVTSGDFEKRGLDVFLEAAARLARDDPRMRFLVVGSKRLPESAARHPLVREKCLHHKPKSSEPELWMAALDVFLYPARFEEFGLVVAEALALGVPVITSRRVGASECLPEEYGSWLLDAPEPGALAEKAAALLGSASARSELAGAGARALAALDQGGYVATTVRLIEAAVDQNL